MIPMLRSNAQLLCYLTDDANEALATMTEAGLDTDLALAIIEKLLGEEMYILEAREDVGA